MDTQTFFAWSLALGAIAMVALFRLGSFLARPSPSLLRMLGFHGAVFLLVLVESGVLAALAHPGQERLRMLQVLAGPLCVGLSNFWIYRWLSAGERDRVMACGLRACAIGLPLLALATLLLAPAQEQLPIAALLALAGGGLTCWLTFRAWTMGDQMALVMAAGCLVTLPAIAGLYAIALDLGGSGFAFHAAVALAAVLCNAMTGNVLWLRLLRGQRTRETGSVPQIDPVTKLHSSAALVKRMVAAHRRLRRTRREGAVLAVTVFDAERLAVLVGTPGVQEMWMTLAARIQREVGVVNPVGRYWDRCFVALVETIPTRGWLRTASLRLAASLRQPLEVTGRDGEPVRVRVDFGVGAMPLGGRGGEVEDVLDEVQRLAEAGRTLRSRAATRDPATGQAVAVEEAQLDARPGASRPAPLPRGLPAWHSPGS